MSKHIGTLVKTDNSGIKWYRKVANAGDTMISAGTLCELCYNSTYSLQNIATLSDDYCLVRPFSAHTTSYNTPRPILMGVANSNISAYLNTRDTGLPTGWVQYKGPCAVSCLNSVVAGSCAIPASSSGVSGVGHIMMAPAWKSGAASGSVGMIMSTAGAANAAGWTWVYLDL